MDREKVIKGLEQCKKGGSCDGCQYEFQSSQCIFHLHADALAILKEQEAVEPVPPEDEFELYRCGKCYNQLFRCVDKYCSRCGKAVKWE